MKQFTLYGSALDAPGLGSRFDPVLDGVARGLVGLFPPVGAAWEPRDEGRRAAVADASGGGGTDLARTDLADTDLAPMSRHTENRTRR